MAPTTTKSADEVVAGPGLLYVAPLGTTEPTTSSDLSSLPSAWREVGYTDKGSTFSYKITAEGLDVAEELDPVGTRITKRAGTVTFQMAQASRRNLALALNLGAAAANDATTLEPPDESAMLRVMLLRVSTDASAVRGVLFRKVFNTGGLEINFSEAPDKSVIPVEFALEKPTSAKSFIVFPNASGLAA